MRLFDPNFKKHITSYILQCLFAMLIIFVVLFLTEKVSAMTVIASLGASTFIGITMPHKKSSCPRYLIGGYIIGIICGLAMNYANTYLISINLNVFGHSPHVITCALAVGLAIFFMTALNYEHPPAAALAMGLVLETNVLVTAFIALIGITTITLIKKLTERWLRDLL